MGYTYMRGMINSIVPEMTDIVPFMMLHTVRGGNGMLDLGA